MRMMEWNMIENGEKSRNRIIRKLGNDGILFKEKRTNLKYKKEK